jgi:hypothetical protein
MRKEKERMPFYVLNQALLIYRRFSIVVNKQKTLFPKAQIHSIRLVIKDLPLHPHFIA